MPIHMQPRCCLTSGVRPCTVSMGSERIWTSSSSNIAATVITVSYIAAPVYIYVHMLYISLVKREYVWTEKKVAKMSF